MQQEGNYGKYKSSSHKTVHLVMLLDYHKQWSSINDVSVLFGEFFYLDLYFQKSIEMWIKGEKLIA